MKQEMSKSKGAGEPSPNRTSSLAVAIVADWGCFLTPGQGARGSRSSIRNRRDAADGPFVIFRQARRWAAQPPGRLGAQMRGRSNKAPKTRSPSRAR
jgi:hypothetical protein